MKTVAVGIDTLVVGFKIRSYHDHTEAFKRLREAKKEAGQKLFDSDGSVVEWYGHEFIMNPRGTRGYEYVMFNDDVNMRIATTARSGLVMPEVYVRFSSEYLWSYGYKTCVKIFSLWLSTWCDVLEDHIISQVDIAVDVNIDLPKLDLTEGIVTRGRRRGTVLNEFPDIHKESYCRRDTYYRVGTGDIVHRTYDKVYEIGQSKKEWFEPIWLNRGWKRNEGVTRFEFQLRRDFLKDYLVDTIDHLEERLPDIWYYLTREWMRICKVGYESRTGDWEIEEFWRLVQAAGFEFGGLKGYKRKKLKQLKFQHLMSMVKGLTCSAVAVLAVSEGLEAAKFQFYQQIDEYVDSKDFRYDVIKRMVSHTGMDKPHPSLTDVAVSFGGKIIDVIDLKSDR